MKIYFSASISKMNDHFKDNYELIVKVLDGLGHKVIADHVLKKTYLEYTQQTEVEALAIQRKMSQWKKQAEISVFEVSNSSFGIGQEIAQALAATRPVICLYEQKYKPHILRDDGGDLLMLLEYTRENLKTVIKDALDYASEKQDTRFNFFISPTIGNYLDWVAKKKRLPRAVYLRRLIEEDMKQNKEYQA